MSNPNGKPAYLVVARDSKKTPRLSRCGPVGPTGPRLLPRLYQRVRKFIFSMPLIVLALRPEHFRQQADLHHKLSSGAARGAPLSQLHRIRRIYFGDHFLSPLLVYRLVFFCLILEIRYQRPLELLPCINSLAHEDHTVVHSYNQFSDSFCH
ncbi:unnamed protein product [Amoebophrya sp. A120]|nr:unnamed protein product [Amoebophrya sp. A120]|eukprot:GSA120T00020632001.1